MHSLVKAFHWNGFIRVVRGRVESKQVNVDHENVRWRVGIVGGVKGKEELNIKAANLSLVVPVAIKKV